MALFLRRNVLRHARREVVFEEACAVPGLNRADPCRSDGRDGGDRPGNGGEEEVDGAT